MTAQRTKLTLSLLFQCLQTIHFDSFGSCCRVFQ